MLETPEGVMSEAHAISVYLNDITNGRFLGLNPIERAQILQWGDFCSCEIQPNNALTIYAILGYYEFNHGTFNAAVARVKTHLNSVNTHLQGKKFLVGNSVSLADIELFLQLRGYFTLIFSEQDRNYFQNVTSWFTGIANEPHVVEVCGVTRFGKVTQKGPRKIEQPKPQPSKLKLFGNKQTGSTQRVLLTIRYTGANVNHENIAQDNSQKPALLTKSPTGTLPMLETPEGVMSEAHAISVYLNDITNGRFLGLNPIERAQILQWGDFCSCEIQPNNALTIYAILGYYEFNHGTFNAAVARVKTHLNSVNTHLQGKKFLVGNSVSLADIELFLQLRGYFTLIFSEQDRNYFQNVTSWFTGIANEPHVVEVCGVTRFGKVTQKGPRKIEQPKPQPVKAEPKKEAAKKETKEEDDEPKTKKKHPLDDLPPSTFVLDNFKKDFLNTPDKKGALERFWQAYDANGYSIWWMIYQKLPSEGKVLFKTCNFYSMFLQKMENFRKYTFASYGVYGEEGNYDIKGMWMWRGTDIAPQMKEHDSYEYHTFRKIDTNNEKDRKLVEEYWLNVKPDEMCDGLKVQDIVYFR